MSRSTYDHAHIYRAISTEKKIYKCIVDDCPHSISRSLLIGRKANCPTCEGEFVITKDHFRRANLTCIGCGITPGLKKTEENPLKNAKLGKQEVNDLLKAAREAMRS